MSCVDSWWSGFVSGAGLTIALMQVIVTVGMLWLRLRGRK